MYTDEKESLFENSYPSSKPIFDLEKPKEIPPDKAKGTLMCPNEVAYPASSPSVILFSPPELNTLKPIFISEEKEVEGHA